MFTSQYLPINIGRTNPYIRSNEKTIYVKDLLKVYELAVSGESESEDGSVILNKETGLFEIKDSGLVLSAEEVYLANQAYRVATETNFSLFAVLNQEGSPTLFVSKNFRKSRMLVNAFNMQTLIVNHPLLIQKLAWLTDKKVSTSFAWDLFTLCHDLQTRKASYLTSLMVWRYSGEAYMAVNPLMTPHSEDVSTYAVDVLDEIRQLIYGDAEETESFMFADKYIVRKDAKWWPKMTTKHCKEILNMYDELLKKKSNYEQLCDHDYNVRLYYSTNHRYLVNAETFQCIQVTNESVRGMLDMLLKEETCSYSDLRFAWEIAKSN